MRAYWAGTRFFWWGIYIGGVNRGCPTGPTKRWINRAEADGWGLEPIWVGLQAPCFHRGGAKMSSNAARAHQQGIHAAIKAYRAANRLGMNMYHLPIVYDMEGFDPSTARCRRAVKSFMRGWDAVLEAPTAQDPGYYGSAGASHPTAIWGIRPRPGWLWGALPNGRRNVDLRPYVSGRIWPHRLKQYGSGTASASGHRTGVDKDCADGPMYAYLRVFSRQGCGRFR